VSSIRDWEFDSGHFLLAFSNLIDSYNSLKNEKFAPVNVLIYYVKWRQVALNDNSSSNSSDSRDHSGRMKVKKV